MSVQTQIDRISGNVSAALIAIADKGVSVPSGSTSDALAELIASIEAGGSTSGFAKVATGTITASDMTNSVTVEHGLGVVPDFMIMYVNDTSMTSGFAYHYPMSFIMYKKSNECQIILASKGITKSVYGSYDQKVVLTNVFTTASVKFDVSQTYQGSDSYTVFFIANKTYNWIAGVYA